MKARLVLVVGVLLSSLFSQAEERLEKESILDRLELSHSQRSSIQAILLGGMQSLEAVNNQLHNLQIVQVDTGDSKQMVVSLQEQKLRLAETMAVEILSVLTPDQISRLDISPLVERRPAGQNAIKKIKREFEI